MLSYLFKNNINSNYQFQKSFNISNIHNIFITKDIYDKGIWYSKRYNVNIIHTHVID